MALTRERKILIAVAGVACAIFAGDRALSGGMTGPEQASAAGVDAASSSAALIVTNTNTNINPSSSAALDAEALLGRPSLAQRLDQARRRLPGETPDAFTPGPRWRPVVPEQPATVITASGFDPLAFTQRNRLDAVYVTDNEARAVINGRLMRTGDSLDGMTLTVIGERWVEWRGQGTSFRVPVNAAR